MGAQLGSLLVSLEANMARFNADMNKSAQVTEQSMLKMAASSEHVTKALKGLEAQAANAKNAALSMGKGLIFGAAATMGIDAIKNKILGVIGTMADLKTISEKTGASVENLSILSFLSKQAGSDINGVAGALAKMSKGMAGADNETKGAGLALNYLGVSAKDAAGNLKDPAVMFMEVAKKLGEYKDGAGKAAIAQALFGKAGAEMLPTLKIMAEQGDIAAKVTTAQAIAAQQYTRDLIKLDAQKNMLFKTVAMALLPTMSDFTNAMIDASKNTNVLNKSAKDLAGDSTIGSWADSTAMGMARLVDVIAMIPKGLSAVSSSFKVVAADVNVLGSAATLLSPGALAARLVRGENPYMDLAKAKSDREKTLSDANAQYSDLWNYKGNAMESAMAARIANRGKGGALAAAKPTKELNYNSSGEDGEAGKRDIEAAKLAKNTSAGRLKDLEASLAQTQADMEFANKYMAELRSQDIIDLSAYNDYRQRAIDASLAGAVAVYEKEIAEAERYRDSVAKGSEKAAAQTKVNELNAKKAKAVQDGQQASVMRTLELGAAQSDLNKSMKEWNIQQDQSAAQLQFNNDMIGKSTLEVARLTEARRIELDIEEKIRQAQKNGTITAESIERYRADADGKSATVKKAITQGAGLRIIEGQKTPGQSEDSAHADNLSTLEQAKAIELANTEKWNRAIEIENARHEKTQLDLKMATQQSIVSLMSNSSDQLYSVLKQAGLQQTAIGKAAFLASKAMGVAQIILNTNVAAATALAPPPLGLGPIAGMGLAGVIKGMGYASAGMVAGLSIAEASARNGYDIPAGTNPVTQLHEKEMVLPKAQADVIRGLASGGGRSLGSSPISQTINIRIDGTTDMARNQQLVKAAVQQGNAELVDRLQRAGRI